MIRPASLASAILPSSEYKVIFTHHRHLDRVAHKLEQAHHWDQEAARCVLLLSDLIAAALGSHPLVEIEGRNLDGAVPIYRDLHLIPRDTMYSVQVP